jgi:hypothetical protein
MSQDPTIEKRKKSAGKFLVALGVPVVGGIIIHAITDQTPRMKSIATYLEGVALIFVIFFILLLVLFQLPVKDCAKMAAVPAGFLVSPALILIALVLYVLLITVGLAAWLFMTVTGKKEWGTGSLVDIFTWKWWKSKGWRSPSRT